MNYSDIHIQLRQWYKSFGRHDLPWRKTNDPYVIYISEMMLQQTQVKTVLDRFFFPFLKRFPTLESIKASSIDEILHAWQGLGYYRRARYIHACAQIASPSLPTDPKELVKLPGIGKSTAHAIAAFSKHYPVAVLDANVKRILYRFFAKTEAKERELWKMAEILLDHEEPYIYNQAMMDLGATVCLPKSPKCEICPFASRCMGRESPMNYPQKRVLKKRPIKQKKIAVLQCGTKLFMRKRKTELLGGLWEFPEMEDLDLPVGNALHKIVQEYTHFKLEAELFLLQTKKSDHMTDGEWIDIASFGKLATSTLEKKILKVLFETDTH
ncbi:A/G-specific adenine glycosylase [Hydrogenimonas cancrithermarum]|uniref:Adenine DNA glycosylase n=1 Tax=Hydrogenimonas cancrithermarum TaxID=2993563 RepID=A0ABN6WYA8_9BACT|nr:A/G-specific adenine glycosylase [Hydrogenimonas cancrithermarum]BDY13786.1 A/G-specific adenine glycosylase [Hydrogenimonas cancrithermarum]